MEHSACPSACWIDELIWYLYHHPSEQALEALANRSSSDPRRYRMSLSPLKYRSLLLRLSNPAPEQSQPERRNRDQSSEEKHSKIPHAQPRLVPLSSVCVRTNCFCFEPDAPTPRCRAETESWMASSNLSWIEMTGGGCMPRGLEMRLGVYVSSTSRYLLACLLIYPLCAVERNKRLCSGKPKPFKVGATKQTQRVKKKWVSYYCH